MTGRPGPVSTTPARSSIQVRCAPAVRGRRATWRGRPALEPDPGLKPARLDKGDRDHVGFRPRSPKPEWGKCPTSRWAGPPGGGRAHEAAAKEVAAAEAKEKAKAAPRPPADPRLKYLKKFHGKFLPRGPLRDRHKALMQRWDSGEDHGGVTVEELKSLLQDWRASREKPARPAKVSS